LVLGSRFKVIGSLFGIRDSGFGILEFLWGLSTDLHHPFDELRTALRIHFASASFRSGNEVLRSGWEKRKKMGHFVPHFFSFFPFSERTPFPERSI
jgi:hypothetical protein